MAGEAHILMRKEREDLRFEEKILWRRIWEARRRTRRCWERGCEGWGHTMATAAAMAVVVGTSNT